MIALSDENRDITTQYWTTTVRRTLTPRKKISVWIVEDNDLYRRSLYRLLNDRLDIHCDRTFSNCNTVISALRKGSPPDVILHDIGFPGMDGVTCIRIIKELHPTALIAVLTVYDDARHVCEALSAGALGYILKSSTEAMIVRGIHDIVAGGSPMNSFIARYAIERLSNSSEKKSEYDITPREHEILTLIISGAINKSIARQLNMSVHTVDSHLRKIYKKLQVHNRTEALAKAMKEKIV